MDRDQLPQGCRPLRRDSVLLATKFPEVRYSFHRLRKNATDMTLGVPRGFDSGTLGLAVQVLNHYSSKNLNMFEVSNHDTRRISADAILVSPLLT